LEAKEKEEKKERLGPYLLYVGIYLKADQVAESMEEWSPALGTVVSPLAPPHF